MKTFVYSQPDDYHFCLDSVILAERVSHHYQEPLEQKSILDLGAGCGILGLDLAYLRKDVRTLISIDLQKVFAPHYSENLLRLNRCRQERGWSRISAQFIVDDMRSLPNNSFDLIVCNPPFFHSEKGLLPPNPIKAQCHFFLTGNEEDWVHQIAKSLRPQGQAYLLTKRTEWGSLIKSLFSKSESLENIRSTHLLWLQK